MPTVSSAYFLARTRLTGVTDLEFWYGDGPGNPTGSAQGIGYVQELLARLTQTPLTTFETTTNGTLDGNNITFPLNQPIYMDATHDTNIASSESAPRVPCTAS